MIFVMIYSYRDLELSKTIEDCFSKADNPNDIVIGCINADNEEYVYNGKYNVKVKNVDFMNRHGCGFGMWEIQKELYNNEEWILRAAPHSRFKQGWDTHYLKYAKKDTVLCSRCLEYMPDGTLSKDKREYSVPECFSDTLVVRLKKKKIKSKNNFKVIFMQAGGMFCHRDWIDKVGYDPHIAMWGEETDLSMRTWLAGFKMIHLCYPQVYHLWHRRNRKSLDASPEFEKMNKKGVFRTKIKLELINHTSHKEDWDEFGCNGAKYRRLLEKEFQNDNT